MLAPLAALLSFSTLVSVSAAPLWTREQLDKRQAASAIVLQFANVLESESTPICVHIRSEMSSLAREQSTAARVAVR